MIAMTDRVDQQPARRCCSPPGRRCAVVVDIAERRPAAHLRALQRGTATAGDILEAAVAEVPEQQLLLVNGNGSRACRSASRRLHGTVDDQRVEATVVVDIDPRRAEPGEGLAGGPRPERSLWASNNADPSLTYRSFPSPRRFATSRSSSPSLSKSPASTPIPAFGLAVRIHGGARQQAHVPEPAVTLVDPQLIGLAIVGDEDVDPAVAVEVRRRDAERGTEIAGHAGRGRHIGERPVAVVVIEAARLWPIRIRRAIVRPAGRTEAWPVRLDAVAQVVADEQSSHPSRSKSKNAADTDQEGSGICPDTRGVAATTFETSAKVPSQLFRHSWFGPRLVRNRSTQPSLSKSPVATPMPYPPAVIPLSFVTSANVNARGPVPDRPPGRSG